MPDLATNALTSLANARLYVKRHVGADANDDLLTLLINGYSDAITRYCERQFKPAETPATKVFGYAGRGYLSLAPYDLRAVTSFVVGGIDLTDETLAVTEYLLEPQSKTPELTYLWVRLKARTLWPTLGDFKVTITGNWGMTSVPDDVETACLSAVADGYRNPEGAGSRTLGELDYQEAVEVAEAVSRNLSPDVRGMLSPFVRVSLF